MEIKNLAEIVRAKVMSKNVLQRHVRVSFLILFPERKRLHFLPVTKHGAKRKTAADTPSSSTTTETRDTRDGLIITIVNCVAIALK
jgi:hypothetical protein